MENTLKILDVFGRFTGLRHCSISEKSGEEFYHKYLNFAFKNAFSNNLKLKVDLDGVRGYSPSFIDEAFGNLVFDFKLKNVKKHLIIKSDDFDFWKQSIQEDSFESWELKRKKNEFPKKTCIHEPWWKIENGDLLESVWIKPNEL